MLLPDQDKKLSEQCSEIIKYYIKENIDKTEENNNPFAIFQTKLELELLKKMYEQRDNTTSDMVARLISEYRFLLTEYESYLDEITQLLDKHGIDYKKRISRE